MTEPVLSVLCVCTGNICRSPVAERLLQQILTDGVQVTSAGTRALVGEPVSSPMDRFLAADGATADAFVARRLTASMIADADLVLALTRAHRGDVVELHPRAVRRTFTLLEFARLLEAVGRDALPPGPVDERLRAAIPLATGQRRSLAEPILDDVADPYRRPDSAYRSSYSAIRHAVDRISAVLTP